MLPTLPFAHILDAVLPAFLLALFLADVRTCACDAAQPATLEARECSLCKAAEQQPLSPAVFFLKDVNATKPNRTLALPRGHFSNSGALEDLPPSARAALFTAAIAKAETLWPGAWGIAYNGIERRTQCHTHVHIGKLLPESENEAFLTVDAPADIPAPEPGTGLWVHAVGGKLHVHSGEQLNETVLVR